jgi:Fur family ferric uptake transcriptional regulator
LLNPSGKRTLYSTSTRRAIVDAMRLDRRYWTAGELYRILKDQYPKLALSTVYRTLELLEGQGSVSSRSEAGGETAFVYCSDAHHHHAICRICGHVDEVNCRAMEEFKSALLAQQSFDLDDHSMEFYGRCAACRAEGV